MQFLIIRLLQSYYNKIATKIVGVEFSKWDIESFIHHSHFVTRLVTYIYENNKTYGFPPPPHRDPTYEDSIYLTIMISKSWTISTLLRNLGHVRIISKVSGLGGREQPVSA
jgi:hypothetical protein